LKILKEVRKILIWFLIFVVVAGSLYFINSILPDLRIARISESDIIQYAPFIFKFDTSSQDFTNNFSNIPFSFPQYNSGFLVKYNNVSDLYVFDSIEKVRDYVNTLSKSTLDKKITKGWLNGFQIFQIEAESTYYVTQWRNFIFISNNADTLKVLFDRIIQGSRSQEESRPTMIFNTYVKNTGFVDFQGKDIFAEIFSVPFLTLRYPLTFCPSADSMKISFTTNGSEKSNNLKIFNFDKSLFEMVSNNPHTFKELLGDNFLSTFSKEYNIDLEEIFKDTVDFSEFILFDNYAPGLILCSNAPDKIINDLRHTYKITPESYKGTEILKLEADGKTLYVSKTQDLLLFFGNNQEITKILDNQVELLTYNCSLYLKFAKEFNSISTYYSVPEAVTLFESFSVYLTESDSAALIQISQGE